MERHFVIGLKPAHGRQIPGWRWRMKSVEPALYGPLPVGLDLYEIAPGDVINDPALIAIILNVKPNTP